MFSNLSKGTRGVCPSNCWKTFFSMVWCLTQTFSHSRRNKVKSTYVRMVWSEQRDGGKIRVSHLHYVFLPERIESQPADVGGCGFFSFFLVFAMYLIIREAHYCTCMCRVRHLRSKSLIDACCETSQGFV